MSAANPANKKPDEEMPISASANEILKRTDVSDDVKKHILSILADQEKDKRTFGLETRKWRYGTPLAIALTGVITIAANFMVDWLKSEHDKLSNITLEQLKNELSIVTTRLNAELARQAAENSAALAIKADEKKFEFEIVRTELARDDLTDAQRAQTLLFLTRSGILSDLREAELKLMVAEAETDPDKNALPVLAAPGQFAQGFSFGRFDSKAPRLMKQLMDDFGLNDTQAAAIVGNLGFETAGFRLVEELATTGGKGGLGWGMWSGPRRIAFEKLCSDRNLDCTSDEANYAFLKSELSGSESGAIAAIRSLQSLEDGVRSFEQHYLRAGFKYYDSRILFAQRALDITRSQ